MANIVSDPDVLGGKPRIEGHRVSVVDVVELLEAGYSSEEVASQLELTGPEVGAARRYWQHHPGEITSLLDERQSARESLRSESRAPSK